MMDTAPPPQVPSPSALVRDDSEVNERALARFSKKSRFSRLFSFHRATHKAHEQPTTPATDTPTRPSLSSLNVATQQIPEIDITPIDLDNSALAGEDTGIYTDRYEWAILYENQRGVTLFSSPYYSSLSLLPSDPSPFTLPDASLKRSNQAPISLENYPLPDGNWQWVSRCWMIDMRTDTGEVQHDGFEYNWFFRRHHWRAQIGMFNAGGWVRRRRWVRLMVRPAKARGNGVEGPAPSVSASSKKQLSIGSGPPSVNTQGTEGSVDWNEINPDEVWLGDDEEDWQHCHALMKKFGRDGRKLDLWRLWLGFHHPEHKGKFLEVKEARREKQWTEDERPLDSEMTATDILSREYVSIAPRDHVIAVLRKHGQDLLRMFVFPESRAEFLKLVAQAGMLAEVNIELGSEVDFWSYASGLGGSIKTKQSLPEL